MGWAFLLLCLSDSQTTAGIIREACERWQQCHEGLALLWGMSAIYPTLERAWLLSALMFLLVERQMPWVGADRQSTNRGERGRGVDDEGGRPQMVSERGGDKKQKKAGVQHRWGGVLHLWLFFCSNWVLSVTSGIRRRLWNHLWRPGIWVVRQQLQ